VLPDIILAEAPPLLAPYVKLIPGFELHLIPERAVGWWQTEDLPDFKNRVRVVGDNLHRDYTLKNTEAADRLIHRWTSVLKSSERNAVHVIPFSLYFRNNIPLQAVGHQCGTCCFGSDPKTSVLDLNCLTHDLITFMSSMVAGQSHFRISTSYRAVLKLINQTIELTPNKKV
jgi:hypothetical protein